MFIDTARPSQRAPAERNVPGPQSHSAPLEPSHHLVIHRSQKMSEQIRVLISSTARDLPQHRDKVRDACMDLGVFYPDMMEHLTAADANALEISLAIADRADVYIGIIGFRYGCVPEGNVISVTEAEYNLL